jgi:hypothetical protein
MLPQQRLQQQRLQQQRLHEVNEKWVSAAPGVPLQTTHVRNIDVHSQNEGTLLGELQLYILGQYTDFKKAMDVWTKFLQIYSYDTPFDEEAFTDEMGDPLNKNDVTYQNILDYWMKFIEDKLPELEMDIPQTPRTITDTDSSVLDGGRKSSKKKPKKASKKKSKKARKSSRNTMVRKKSRGH